MNRCTILRGSTAVRGLTTAAKVSSTNSGFPHPSNWNGCSYVQHQSPSYDAKQELKVPWPSNSEPREAVIPCECLDTSNVPGEDGARIAFTQSDAGTDNQNLSASKNIHLKSVAEARSAWNFPKSPLMNPARLQAKQKHQAPKQRPSELSTELQRELAKNPFALALDTPVRTCGLTGASLPRYFLQDFKILAHPETGDPSFLPTSLTGKGKRLDSSGEDLGAIGGITGYAISNRRALGSMQSPVGGYYKNRGGKGQRAHHKLIPMNVKIVKEAMRVAGRTKWRQDMADFVLELMRRRIVEHLVALGKLKRGYLVGCADWEDAASKPQVAAFLWTGGDPDIEHDYEPGEYSTLDLGMKGGLKGGEKKRERKVPVYNLRILLGQEKLVELRQTIGNEMFGRELVALKHKNMTVELQTKLWRLQGYVAEHHGVQQEAAQGEEQTEDEDQDEDLRNEMEETEAW